jgi:hypothetical protein
MKQFDTPVLSGGVSKLNSLGRPNSVYRVTPRISLPSSSERLAVVLRLFSRFVLAQPEMER